MKKKFLKSNRKVLKSMKDNLSKVDGRKKMKYSTQAMVEKLLGIFFNREKSFNSVESNARLSGANQTVSNTLASDSKKRFFGHESLCLNEILDPKNIFLESLLLWVVLFEYCG